MRRSYTAVISKHHNKRLMTIGLLIAVAMRLCAGLMIEQTAFGLALPILPILGIETETIRFGSWSLLVYLPSFTLFAWAIQKCITYYGLLHTHSLLPTYLAMILGSLAPSIAYANLHFVVLTALTGGVFILYQMWHHPQPQLHALNLSIIMSLLSLLDFRLIYLMPVIWWAMWRLKALTLKALIASAIGLISCYWMTTCYLLIMGKTMAEIGTLWHDYIMLSNQYDEPLSRPRLLYLSLILIAMLINSILTRQQNESIKTRAHLSATRLLLIGVATLTAALPASRLMLSATLVPLLILVAYHLSSLPRRSYRWSIRLFTIITLIVLFLELWTF